MSPEKPNLNQPIPKYAVAHVEVQIRFLKLKEDLFKSAEKNKKVSGKQVVEFIKLWNEIYCVDEYWLYKHIWNFITEVKPYFKKSQKYVFITRSRSGSQSFDFMLFFTIMNVTKRYRENKIESGAACDKYVIKELKSWLTNHHAAPVYSKSQIWAIASFISKHFFGFWKDRTISPEDRIQEYFQICKDHLKDDKVFDDRYFKPFTKPSQRRS